MLLPVAVFAVLLATLPAAECSCAWDNCPRWQGGSNAVNIHIVAHTHDDMGWLKTADDYFTGYNPQQVNIGVQFIIDTVVEALKRNPARKFCYAEVGFLTRWLEDRSEDEIHDLVTLVNNGQLELVGGGWVQPDEANTHYVDLIDQYTLGLRQLQKTINSSCAVVRTGWQIDPFGHSREHANLLAMMGYESVYFAREHHLEHDLRKSERKLEFSWYTSNEVPDRKLLGGAFFNHYNFPPGMCYDKNCNDDPIIIDPRFDNYNPDKLIYRFSDYIENDRLPTIPHRHVLVLMGDDFQYQNAEKHFRNLDNLIWLVRNRTSYTIDYSTPACYTSAVLRSGVSWTDKMADFFPYASGSNNYWTGYFTSKPAHKGLIRAASNWLQTLRQLTAFAQLPSAHEFQSAEVALERALALSQHHDGVTGTSKAHVTADYVRRILVAQTGAQGQFRDAMTAISRRLKANNAEFPALHFCPRLNETACEFTQSHATTTFAVVLHNAHSRFVEQLVRIPVWQSNVIVFDANQEVVAEASVLTNFDNNGQIGNKDAAPYVLNFVAQIPPHGFTTYFVMKSTRDSPLPAAHFHEPRAQADANVTLSNEFVTVTFDNGNLVYSVANADRSFRLHQHFMYYYGHDNNGQASGAYVFRPQEENAWVLNETPNLTIVNNEARQVFAPWMSQTVRLNPRQPYIEFEWTVGPLPETDDGKRYGREVVNRFETKGDVDIKGTWWTDANGRQLMKRVRNFAPDYNFEYTEPIASNFFPVNTRALIKDERGAIAYMTDRAQAGGSMAEDWFELMVHRRDFYDDGYGVGEALNELGPDGRGLVVRGVHRVYVGTPSKIARQHREGALLLYHSPIITFAEVSAGIADYARQYATSYSGVADSLPMNVHLLTLKQLEPGALLLRLEHIYAKTEDATLSQPATVNIGSLFKDLKVQSVQELSLGANREVGNPYLSVTLYPQDIKTFRVTVKL